MLKIEDFKLIQFQARISGNFQFIGEKTGGLDLASEAVKKLKFFDAPPTVLPVGSDDPSDIPRVILSQKDGAHSLEASLVHINYVQQFREDNRSTFAELRSRIFSNSNRVIKFILEKGKLNGFDDLDMSGRFLTLLAQSSNDLIKQAFFKTSKAQENYYFISLNLTWKQEAKDVNYNRGIEIRSLRKRDDIKNDEALGCKLELTTKFWERKPSRIESISLLRIKTLEKEFSRFVEELPKLFV